MALCRVRDEHRVRARVGAHGGAWMLSSWVMVTIDLLRHAGSLYMWRRMPREAQQTKKPGRSRSAARRKRYGSRNLTTTSRLAISERCHTLHLQEIGCRAEIRYACASLPSRPAVARRDATKQSLSGAYSDGWICYPRRWDVIGAATVHGRLVPASSRAGGRESWMAIVMEFAILLYSVCPYSTSTRVWKS
jgi:hypothetical protein